MTSLSTSEEISSEALDLNVEIKGVRFKKVAVVKTTFGCPTRPQEKG